MKIGQKNRKTGIFSDFFITRKGVTLKSGPILLKKTVPYALT
jgi:hypothetical protein